MIKEYFQEKQRIIDILRTIYRDKDNKNLLIKFSNTKDFGIALEMGFVDVRFTGGYHTFRPIWAKKAHEEFCVWDTLDKSLCCGTIYKHRNPTKRSDDET